MPSWASSPSSPTSTVFLLIPTLVVVVGAFLDSDNAFTWPTSRAHRPAVLRALRNSVVLSAVTAFAGAVVGGILAYAVSTARPNSVTKRFVTSLCGVLAQFGGVALAFAFIATVRHQRVDHRLAQPLGIDRAAGSGCTGWNKGLMLVYLYFQIPLMVIVFLPAVEGLRPQWREATETLGGSTWILAPGRRPHPAAVVPRRDCCCCSPTRSPPTPPPRR